tara:strand:- start:1851 stop:2138 length:288 start_codon:yes stop_codon:yes gene_type:complete
VVQKFILLKVGFKMKMEIIESDLKQIFQWLKVTDDIVKSQQALLETNDAAIVQLQEAYKVEAALAKTHQDAIESLEERIINIETSWNPITQEDNK